MTGTPSIVVIALAANELSSPRAAAILKSAQEVLGQNVTLRVEVIGANARTPSPVNEHPTSAYAWLVWDTVDPRIAHLRCYVPDSRRWVQRDVTFAEQDPENERGRTLGFVIGSIFVEGREPQRPLPVPQRPRVQSQPPPEPKRFAIAVAGSIAAPGDATSLGAWIGAERAITPILWLGLAGEGRVGTVPEAQAGTRFLAGGAVSTLRLWPQRSSKWLGIRAFVGAEHVTFTHQSEDDPTAVTQSAWVPKLDLLGHASLGLSAASMLFLDIGANCRFGSTDVYVHQSVRAQIPAFVGIGRVGVGTVF